MSTFTTVTINPDDPDVPRRITLVLNRTGGDWSAALRALGQPEPPLVPEPMLHAAVVRDHQGEVWTRTGYQPGFMWVNGSRSNTWQQSWEALDAAEVLFEGVPE